LNTAVTTVLMLLSTLLISATLVQSPTLILAHSSELTEPTP
jgi:hypothetical protein